MRTRSVVDVRTDGELAMAAAEGSTDAFDALYRRYADVAWRVAYAVTGNADDAADAVSEAFVRVLQALPAGRLEEANLFRGYLLAATRNAAIDGLRRGGRLEHTDRLDHLDQASPTATPGERVADGEDRVLVAEAFRALPERWRSVLWLTEVEGIPPREAAPLLGVTANNAAQLAVRARAGLRERFVQAHLRADIPEECRACAQHLGAYVTGTLAPRDLAKVDQHLAACDECRARKDELEHVGSTLRRCIVPLPLALGAATLAKWKTASAANAAASTKGLLAGEWQATMLEKLAKPLLATSSALFTLGVIGASVVGAPARPRLAPPAAAATPAPAATSDAAASSAPPATDIRLASSSGPVADSFARFDQRLAGATTTALPPTQDAVPATSETPGAPVAASPRPRGPAAPIDTGGTTPSSPPPTDDPGDDPAPEPAPVVQVGIGGTLLGETGGVTLGAGDGSCTGGALGPVAEGCPPPSSDAGTAGVTVTTDGSLLGPASGQEIRLGI